MTLPIPFLFLHFRTLFHSTERGVPLPSQIEDNMNHQTTNSSFSTELSAPTTVTALVISDQSATAPAEDPQTNTKRRSPSSSKARDSKPTAGKDDNRCRHYTFKGRRCRLTALDPASGLCFRHLGREFRTSDEDLSS